DGLGEPLRLLEGDDPVAAADKRVPPEPAAVDGLEQKCGAPARAQVEIGRERRDQRGVDGRSHRKPLRSTTTRLVEGRTCFNAQAVSAPELLRSLLVAPGPSGHEEEPTRIWREAASAFAEMSSDTLGTTYARVRAGEGAPTPAV